MTMIRYLFNYNFYYGISNLNKVSIFKDCNIVLITESKSFLVFISSHFGDLTKRIFLKRSIYLIMSKVKLVTSFIPNKNQVISMKNFTYFCTSNALQ